MYCKLKGPLKGGFSIVILFALSTGYASALPGAPAATGLANAPIGASAAPRLPLPPPLPPAPNQAASGPPMTLQAPLETPAPLGGFKLHFERVPLADLIALAYTDVVKSSFALDSSLASRADVVSVVFQSKKPQDVLPVLKLLVEGIGGEVVKKNGIDLYRLKSGNETQDWELHTYTPQYYSVDYLTGIASGMFKGKFGQDGSGTTGPVTVQPAASDTGQTSALSHNSMPLGAQVVFNGPPEEWKKLLVFFKQIDIPRDNFDVTAQIYEVQNLKHNETALSLLLKLGTSVATTIGTAGTSNLLTLGAGGFSISASALASNTQFKLVSEPHMLIRSGQNGNLVVATQTQVDTGAVLDKNGNAVDTRAYQQAGLTFNLTATSREKIIDVTLNSQVSDFGTANGTTAPDIVNRTISQTFDMRDGETIALAGLRQDKDTGAQSGLPFLPWNLSKSSDDTSTEFLFIVKIKKHEEQPAQ